MATTIRILDINPGSDGDGRKWPKHHYVRNDEYFKERIATDKWIKDLPGGPERDVIYRLNKLPNGYAGFERARADSRHIDRFIYGHPNGQFRSLNEFYPHFKHLMDHGGPAGCTCKLCLGQSRKKKSTGAAVRRVSRDESERSETPPRQSTYFTQKTQQPQEAVAHQPNLISPFTAKQRGRPRKDGRPRSESPLVGKRRLIDHEGTLDIYESLVNRVKEAQGRDNVIDMQIEEPMSPDWRCSNATSENLFKEWRGLPSYVPRLGEVVLFVRNLRQENMIAWDRKSQTFRWKNRKEATWSDQPEWEAGVVTQMPQEPMLDQDLVTDEDKEQAVNYSGFRVEPVSEPGNEHKPFAKQYKHVPLHAIRPFVYWRECLNGIPETSWHATINHALTMSSSFCVIGRYRFRALWPHATIFCRGVYIGPELIMVGDSVRLFPRKREQRNEKVTDVMIVDAIRLRFVNLDLEEDDMAPEDVPPYQTSLHLRGRLYTSDPMRSFDGMGKIPINPDSGILPANLAKCGAWYHYTDPSKPAARVEVPFTRVLGRFFEGTALSAWFSASLDIAIQSSFEKTHSHMSVGEDSFELSRGLPSIEQARLYSRQNDQRIALKEGKTWFWADTRIEQLDLHEVNGRFVGVKDQTRTEQELRRCRTALKALDGKKSALEEYRATEKARELGEMPIPSSRAYGMVVASRQFGSESPGARETEDAGEEEVEDEGKGEDKEKGQEQNEASELDVEQDEESSEQEFYDPMDLHEDVDEHFAVEEKGDQSEGETKDNESSEGVEHNVQRKVETITIYSSDEEDEEEQRTSRLASELAKSIRTGAARLR